MEDSVRGNGVGRATATGCGRRRVGNRNAVNQHSVGPGGVSGLPGLQARPGEQPVCLVIPEEDFLRRIPTQAAFELERDGHEVAEGRRVMADFLMGTRPPARTDTLEYPLQPFRAGEELSHARQQPAGGAPSSTR